MDRVNWKSFSQSGFKSLEPAETPSDPEVPMPDEGDINQVTESDVAQEIIENAFSNDVSETPPPPPNGFDLSISPNSATPGYYIDPATGKLVKDETKIPFPAPTLAQIEEAQVKANLDLKIADWDRVTEMYKMKLDEYTNDKNLILEIIKKGAIPADQLVVYKQLVDLAEKAINTINKALIGIPVKIEELKTIYKNEMATFQKAMKGTGASNIEDYNTGTWEKRSKIVEKVSLVALQNLDDWIGEPGVGLRVVRNTTRGTVLYYAENQKYLALVSSDGSPVSETWFDPSREWIVSNAGITLNPQKIKVPGDDKLSDQTEDVTFMIDGTNLKEDANTGGAKIDIGIPEYVIVKRDSDGNIKEKDLDSSDQEIRLIPKEFATIVDPGTEKKTIVQTLGTDPANGGEIEDMSNFAQVRVAYVKIFTDIDHAFVNSNGQKGFSHIVQCFTADDRIAIEMRFVNPEGSDCQASDYQFAIHSDRELPVEIDASGLVLTCEGKMNSGSFTSITENYGMKTAGTDGTVTVGGEALCDGLTQEKKDAGVLASKFNYGQFIDDNNYAQHLSPEDKVASSEDGTGFGSEARRTSGLWALGLIGTIRGCGNDFIAFGDPSKTQSWRAREGKDEKDNPFYSNIFFGSSGASREVVFATDGDFYGTNVTALWKKGQKPRGITGVTMKTTFGMELKDLTYDKSFLLNYKPDNIRNFLYVTGGEEVQIKNHSDTNLNGKGQYSSDSAPKPEMQTPEVFQGDDFYFTNGKGKYSCPNTTAKNDSMDLDADGQEQSSIDNSLVEEMATDLFNAITDFEENMIDPELLPDINELGFDYYSSVADAQSSFFAAISQSLGIENEQLGAYDAENPQQAAPTGANGVDQKFNE